MPNRIFRDCTDSERVNGLSCQAEVFFYRLMMKADDHGGFHGKPAIVKAQLFPLRSDAIRETDISRWIAECVTAGLIVSYEAESKRYVRIIEFGQRLRTMKSKFPLPNVRELPADVRMSLPDGSLKRIRIESEVRSEEKAPADNSKNHGQEDETPKAEGVHASAGQNDSTAQKDETRVHGAQTKPVQHHAGFKQRFLETSVQVEGAIKEARRLGKLGNEKLDDQVLWVGKLIDEMLPSFSIAFPTGDFQKFSYKVLDHIRDPEKAMKGVTNRLTYSINKQKGELT